MAEFGVAATQLSDPQGRGTEAIAPVQEQVSRLGIGPLVDGVAGMIINEKKAYDKRQADAYKTGVVGDYLAAEEKYRQAFNQGSWDAARTGAASRSNFAKFIASNPGLVDELTKARASFYGGTEMGTVEKKEDFELKLRQKTLTEAAEVGYQFYPNMSPEAEQASIDSFQSGRRVNAELEKRAKERSRQLAENSEARAAGNYEFQLADRQMKEEATTGLIALADKNFDAIRISGEDLARKVASGQMTAEAAMQYHQGNIARVNAAITSVGASFPEIAGPFSRMFNEMDVVVKNMLDPNKKTAEQAKLLEDQFKILVTTQKVMALEKNPKLLQAYTATSLFPGEVMVNMVGSPAVADWMLRAAQVDSKLTGPSPMLGKDDKEIFATMKKAIGNLQAGKIPVSQREKATVEAVNIVNQALKETSDGAGSLAPTALKEASKFYASTEFGKLSAEGKIDKQTAANAQRVFQVQYEPAVREAIANKLNIEVGPGQLLADNVKFEIVGSEVRIVPTIQPSASDRGLISGFVDRGMQGTSKVAGAAEVKEAAAGLNQLLRMHAHLEGTTDYKKYWNENKHLIIPGYFMEGVDVGTVRSGYKFLGGDARNPKNWEEQVKSGK